jgi:hypothetical protein
MGMSFDTDAFVDGDEKSGIMAPGAVVGGDGDEYGNLDGFNVSVDVGTGNDLTLAPSSNSMNDFSSLASRDMDQVDKHAILLHVIVYLCSSLLILLGTVVRVRNMYITIVVQVMMTPMIMSLKVLRMISSLISILHIMRSQMMLLGDLVVIVPHLHHHRGLAPHHLLEL